MRCGARYGSPSRTRNALEADVEEYRNEFLDGLVGQMVQVKQLDAPQLDEEFAKVWKENPRSFKTTPLKSRNSVLVLESYDQLGIIVRTLGKDPITNFVPWGSVIELASLDV